MLVYINGVSVLRGLSSENARAFFPQGKSQSSVIYRSVRIKRGSVERGLTLRQGLAGIIGDLKHTAF